MIHLFYIHGFLSGPNAVKATKLKEYILSNALEGEFDLHCPDYPDPPAEAYDYLCGYFAHVFEMYKPEEVCLIGSSMGGFFSTLIAQQYQCNAVLLNPCIHPQNYFKALIGPQFNECTNRHFELKKEMLEVLTKLDDSAKVMPDTTYVLLGMQDEVLDYNLSHEFYEGAVVEMFPEEDHAFTKNFDGLIPDIFGFAKGGRAYIDDIMNSGDYEEVLDDEE